MEIISGWQVFNKEEITNENAIKILVDMIESFDREIPIYKEGTGMRKILECQKEACYKAITALNTTLNN